MGWQPSPIDYIGANLHLWQPSPFLDRYQAAVADVDLACSPGVWWFTLRAQVCLLQQNLSDAGATVTIRSLRPRGVAP